MARLGSFGKCPPSVAVLCTVRFVGPNYKNQEGLAPDVVGGERCLAAVSFLSWVA